MNVQSALSEIDEDGQCVQALNPCLAAYKAQSYFTSVLPSVFNPSPEQSSAGGFPGPHG